MCIITVQFILNHLFQYGSATIMQSWTSILCRRKCSMSRRSWKKSSATSKNAASTSCPLCSSSKACEDTVSMATRRRGEGAEFFVFHRTSSMSKHARLWATSSKWTTAEMHTRIVYLHNYYLASVLQRDRWYYVTKRNYFTI